MGACDFIWLAPLWVLGVYSVSRSLLGCIEGDLDGDTSLSP